MGLYTLRKQCFRNFGLAALWGQILTFGGAFTTRYTPKAWLLLPYGVDNPGGPAANVIRNAFWSLIVLCAISLFPRKPPSNIKAVTALLTAIQFFVGNLLMILLDSLWQSVRIGHFAETLQPSDAPTLLLLFAMGQALAYWGRKVWLSE